jgi:hypothetical protein
MSGIRHLFMLAAGAAILALGLAAPAAWAGAARPAGASATIPTVNSLDAVACATPKACVGVGDDLSITDGKSVVINVSTGAAHAWSGSLANDSLNAVACPGKTTCLAVADDAVASVKVSSGAMKVTDMPKSPKNGIVALGTIACATSKLCYAVGFEGTFSSPKAIVIRLSGTGKPLALMKDSGTGIGSIACPSAHLCLESLANRAGTKIQVLKDNHFGATHAVPAKTRIQRIACFKADVCYALAGKLTTGYSPTDEMFPLNPKNGALGKMVKLIGFSGTGLACASASRCVVVGYTGLGATAKSAFVTIAHGKAGKVTHFGPADSSYSAVGCASATVCYATGLAPNNEGAIVTKV